MRVLLFTGKGGVGKTTAAAATAAVTAARGLKTLVISTDPAHSLADALGVAARRRTHRGRTGLAGQQVDAQQRFERTWRDVQSYLLSALEAVGVDPLEAEELTVLPGADEVLALLAVREQIDSGRYDVVIVDCAPTAETLRLLVAARRAGLVHAADLAGGATGGPLAAAGAQPGQRACRCRPTSSSTRWSGCTANWRRCGPVLADAERTIGAAGAHARGGRRRRGAADHDDAVALRLPGRRGARQPDHPARRPVARPLGGGAGAAAGRGRRSRSRRCPILRVPYQAAEPVGLRRAGRGRAGPPTASSTRSGCPARRRADGRRAHRRRLHPVPPAAVRREGPGRPEPARATSSSSRSASWRRLLTLPSALRRCDVTGARFVDERLLVDFVPDPAVWMNS